MVLFENLQSKKEKICVVGLGYVGLPLAVILAKKFNVVGFEISQKRVEELKNGSDHTNEVSSDELKSVQIEYTIDPQKISEAKFIIVAVPTPIDENNIPNLTLVEKATEMVGKNLARESVVVYESTVYPGVTEEICLPILEKESGFKAGIDFKIGYSPERVNPGDKEHTIDKITKVVSGMDEESLELIAQVYGSITNIHKAESIKVAEAAKVIENTQRDLNIALMNELAVLFSKMDISVYDVIEAAGTKWNFLKFKPGLVGGHCIGVDPYYLTYKAEKLGHKTNVILAGRGVNDSMHKFLADQIVLKMKELDKDLSSSNVVILGITFKENIPDIRNSKVVNLYNELVARGARPKIYDPHANRDEVKREYGIELCEKQDLPQADTLIAAVAHDEFVNLTPEDLKAMMNHNNLLLIDVKRLYNKKQIEEQGIVYWTL